MAIQGALYSLIMLSGFCHYHVGVSLSVVGTVYLPYLEHCLLQSEHSLSMYE